MGLYLGKEKISNLSVGQATSGVTNISDETTINISGILKGENNKIVSATPGVDYVIPGDSTVTSVNGQTGAVILSAADTGAQSTITVNGILKGDGAGGVSAAVPGTDYLDVFAVVFTGPPNALTCNRTAAELYEAWSASHRPGGKQLIGYTNDGVVLNEVRMVYDDGPTYFWLQFSNISYYNNSDRPDNGTFGKVPILYCVDVFENKKTMSSKKTELFIQPAIRLKTGSAMGAIPKVLDTLGFADAFEVAIPDIDYMTPSMGTSSAKVGQMLNVQAVDASGKPTKWETKDVPHGVPAVTASDNGKFLRVVNGAWVAVSISDANGVNF